MTRLARVRLQLSGVLLCCALALPAVAANGAIEAQPSSKINYILVGFAGGFVRHNNPHHGPVQLAQRLMDNGDFLEAELQFLEAKHEASGGEKAKIIGMLAGLLESNKLYADAAHFYQVLDRDFPSTPVRDGLPWAIVLLPCVSLTESVPYPP